MFSQNTKAENLLGNVLLLGGNETTRAETEILVGTHTPSHHMRTQWQGSTYKPRNTMRDNASGHCDHKCHSLYNCAKHFAVCSPHSLGILSEQPAPRQKTEHPTLETHAFVSYLWNFLSLVSHPYLFRIMTTEKYKRETAAARRLRTIIWRKLVLRIRGHPIGEMLKCQEAGNRQEMPILKFKKKKKTESKAIYFKNSFLHSDPRGLGSFSVFPFSSK